MKTKWQTKGVITAAIAGVVLSVTSCGTILHPERRGQPAGHLDAGIVILDGIGLLFFLIPGVIAFIVDFSNNTIYLPPGGSALPSGPDGLAGMQAIPMDSQKLTTPYIEMLVKQHTGTQVDLSSSDVQVTRINAIGAVQPGLVRLPDAGTP